MSLCGPNYLYASKMNKEEGFAMCLVVLAGNHLLETRVSMSVAL